MDPTTARIARALYPQAEIRGESFAVTRLPRGHFDAAIGNVPFAEITLLRLVLLELQRDLGFTVLYVTHGRVCSTRAMSPGAARC